MILWFVTRDVALSVMGTSGTSSIAGRLLKISSWRMIIFVAGIIGGRTDTSGRSATGAVAVFTDCVGSYNVIVTCSKLPICKLLMVYVCPTDSPVMTETLKSSSEMSSSEMKVIKDFIFVQWSQLRILGLREKLLLLKQSSTRKLMFSQRTLQSADLHHGWTIVNSWLFGFDRVGVLGTSLSILSRSAAISWPVVPYTFEAGSVSRIVL